MPKGKFVRSEKDDEKKSGEEFQTWCREENIEHNLVNEKFPTNIWYRYPRKALPPASSASGPQGTASPPESSFIYLDVGAWVGSARDEQGRWGREKPTNIHRDFGLICGPYVLLCSFAYAVAYSTYRCPKWQQMSDNAGSDKMLASLKKVIEILSGASSQLGQVVVRRVAVAPSTNPRWQTNKECPELFVILGDMHLPVLDQMTQSYGNSDMVVVNASNAPRVDRAGRVDLAPLEALVKQLTDTGDTEFLDAVVGFASKLASLTEAQKSGITTAAKIAATVDPGGAIGGVLAVVAAAVGITAVELAALLAVRDFEGVEQNSMAKSQAERWYRYYCEGVDGGLPANIFENAGTHLLQFIEAVVRYQTSSERIAPARLVQCGDLFDFWIGFTCHFQPSSNVEAAIKPEQAADDPRGSDYGGKLVEYWGRNTLRTAQGTYVAKALQKAEASLSPIYLEGNHDNYLAGMAFTAKLTDGSELKIRRRRPNYAENGLFIEHGHQWDSSNANNVKVVEGTGELVTGTDCPLGVFLTQAAFLRPRPIRKFEGKAIKFKSTIGEEIGQRLTQVGCAADRFVDKEASFYAYAMGHTHAACLCTVHVLTNCSSLDDYAKKGKDNPAVSIFFVGSGMRKKNEDRTVRFGWTQLFAGGKPCDWISLEDPYAPEGSWVDGLWIWVPRNKNDGQDSIVNVPPGRYVARVYLKSGDTAAFRTTSATESVEGVSIEGDASASTGGQFVFQNGKPNRDIFLRWAFPPERITSSEAWFGLVGGEGHEAVPNRVLSEITAPDPNFGRWRFDNTLLSFLDRNPGYYEVQVFPTKGSDTPVATVGFSVSRGK